LILLVVGLGARVAGSAADRLHYQVAAYMRWVEGTKQWSGLCPMKTNARLGSELSVPDNVSNPMRGILR